MYTDIEHCFVSPRFQFKNYYKKNSVLLTKMQARNVSMSCREQLLHDIALVYHDFLHVSVMQLTPFPRSFMYNKSRFDKRFWQKYSY